MKINKISIFALILLSLCSLSFAAGLNMVLLNQNPDPVAPGNFVYVNIKLTNTGDSNAKNLEITFLENSYFRLAAAQDATKLIGDLVSGSSDNSAQIVKFKIFVNENTPIGQNTLKFKVDTAQGDPITYEFEILVQEENPSLVIESINGGTLAPGSSQEVSLNLKNSNSVSLKNIVMTLGLDKVEDKVLTTSGSNQVIVGKLDSKTSKEVKFELFASPQATAKPYLLPVTLEYEDALGNSFTKEILTTFQVYAKPQLTLKLESQDKYEKGTITLAFALANPSTTSIKGTQIEIIEDESYEVVSGSFNYVGDLNPDDYQSIRSKVYFKEEKDNKIKLKVTYLDSYNNQNEEVVELDVKTYNAETLTQLGLVEPASKSGLVIIIIILLVAGFIIYRKRFKK